MAPGLIIGVAAHFTVEPLAPGADVTLRCTTPVEDVREIDAPRATALADREAEADERLPPVIFATVPEVIAARGAGEWVSMADVAAAIAAELCGDCDHVFAVRLLAEGIQRFRSLHDQPAAQARWLTPPPHTTGDYRFDVLIAGTVQHLARVWGPPLPDWAAGVPPLQLPWSPFAQWAPTPMRTWPELDNLNIALDVAFTELA